MRLQVTFHHKSALLQLRQYPSTFIVEQHVLICTPSQMHVSRSESFKLSVSSCNGVKPRI